MKDNKDLMGNLLASIEQELIQIDNLRKMLKQIQQENKDCKPLKKYISTMKKIDKITEQLKEDKESLYLQMFDKGVDYLEGALYNITLKRPYLRTGVDMKKFTEMFPKDSTTYKKLIKETRCKGSINVKEAD